MERVDALLGMTRRQANEIEDLDYTLHLPLKEDIIFK